MKSVLFGLSLSFLCLSLLLGACQKEDTPSFKDQLTGHWQSTTVKINDADLSALNYYVLNLQASREFDLDTYTTINGSLISASSGDWLEDDAKQDITLTFNGGNTITYDVILLSATKLEVEYTLNGSRYSIAFKKTSE